MFSLRNVGWLLWAAALCPAPFTLAQSSLPAAPINLGFEEGQVGSPPVGWRLTTAGAEAAIVEQAAPEGKCVARLRRETGGHAPWGNLQQVIAADNYRAAQVELRARMLVSPPSAAARMWLRAEQAGRTLAIVDARNEPSSDGEWAEVALTLDVPAESDALAFGFIAFADATLLVDAVALRGEGPSRRPSLTPALPITPRELENLVAAARLLSYVRFFHPSDQAAGVKDWSRVAIELMEFAAPAADSEQLARRLREFFLPLAPTLEVWSGDASAAAPLSPPPASATARAQWRHFGAPLGQRTGSPYRSAIQKVSLSGAPTAEEHQRGFLIKSLGGGVTCRLPVMVYLDAAGTLPRAAPTPSHYVAGEAVTWSATQPATRWAGVALAWGVMQHFYPYFDVVSVDWDAALTVALRQAAENVDEQAYLLTLRELIAKLQDGHGSVTNPDVTVKSMLPLALGWAGRELVVVGKDTSAPAEIAVGDVVHSLNGVTVEEHYADVSRWISSATEGWRRARALVLLTYDLATSEQLPARLRKPSGAEYEVLLKRVTRSDAQDATLRRPANGADLAPGIVYMNLIGAEPAQLDQTQDALNAARGIVFDVRGYPAGAAFVVIQRLIDKNVASARWNVPIVRWPDREAWEWQTSGRWDVPPLAPRWSAKAAFLTDGSAISYAESIMGIVEAYQLGEIVGAATAGTNGNVNPFVLPGNYHVYWTGMKVLKHDGAQHHGVGILPTIAVERTPAGVAAGRDEVLERAVAALQAKLEK